MTMWCPSEAHAILLVFCKAGFLRHSSPLRYLNIQVKNTSAGILEQNEALEAARKQMEKQIAQLQLKLRVYEASPAHRRTAGAGVPANCAWPLACQIHAPPQLEEASAADPRVTQQDVAEGSCTAYRQVCWLHPNFAFELWSSSPIGSWS